MKAKLIDPKLKVGSIIYIYIQIGVNVCMCVCPE